MRVFVSLSNRARVGTVIVLALVFLVSLVFFGVSRTPASAAFPIYYGPFHTTNDPDSGTCGNNWATDTFDRNFYVNPNNTQMFTETFTSASFVTIAGQSPGACESAANAGHIVRNGIRGTFTGFETVTVTGGTFNPNARCTSATCGTTAGFCTTVYGPSAVCNASSFKFTYRTIPSDAFGSWQNASADQGGNQGDITSSFP